MVGSVIANDGSTGLLETVANARPNVLIGVSGQRGAFNEDVVRKMAAGARRPVIFPLSKSDFLQRGGASRYSRLDRRTWRYWGGQPVSANDAGLPAVPD
ncbi:malic enzyme-like NAD(P)-binding protein [Bradyrhizobium sp. Ash2021]|uniref:malic enzyme-like NAD(P)-binding protein n=1 Tax=Bradyrhizobium sp. Ash2021 TaxID=2954771 RepID=UPI0028154913|nr:malic enzyme-like NAD(P)-binding protein [Bradyrhizobium sp. Ash2021]WMT79535.1 hypothetical protein NL528_46700 [Bradyrhizobium sp. Ash2021]WMT79664.1 hypothetical protein NL528_45440 [Bradyrhizobium sp. Ash2021]